jgi:chromosome segregation ATPase
MSGEDDTHQKLRNALTELEDYMKYIREEHEKQNLATAEKLTQLSECSEQALTELTEGHEEQDKLRAMISTLGAQLQEAHATIVTLEKKQGDAVSRENILNHTLKTSKERIEKLDGDVKSRDSKIVKLNTEITDLKFNTQVLEGQLRDTKTHVADLDVLIKKKDEQISSLNGELTDAEMNRGFLEDQIKGLQATVADRDSTIASLSVDLIDAKVAVANMSETADKESRKVKQLTRALEAASSAPMKGDADSFDPPNHPAGTGTAHHESSVSETTKKLFSSGLQKLKTASHATSSSKPAESAPGGDYKPKNSRQSLG